jgi:hypothetical protein
MPFEVFRPITEPLTSKGGLIQPPLLDHSAHGTIENGDAFLKQLCNWCHVSTVQ